MWMGLDKEGGEWGGGQGVSVPIFMSDLGMDVERVWCDEYVGI